MPDMPIVRTDEPTSRKPPLLWPGVAAAVLLLLLRFGLPIVSPEHAAFGGMGATVCALVILLWWMFFSRVPWPERWGAVGVMVAAMAATPLILHESIVNGMMGLMFYVYALPIVGLGLVGWALACRGLSDLPRRAALVGVIVLACGVFALLRTDGILGGGGSQLAWRWTPTAEERLLAEAGGLPVAVQPGPPAADAAGTAAPVTAAPVTAAPGETAPGEAAMPEAETGSPTGDVPADPRSAEIDAASAPAPSTGEDPATVDPNREIEDDAEALAADESVWPGFRGPNRDGVVPGVRIETDWAKSPPVEIWRRPVGPGWSSFAVEGDLLYTQEQRGDDEVVACYKLTTGEPVWMHRDAARFWESNAGAGPRSTPTLSDGRVYTFGATGIVNALDVRTGAVVWTRNAASDTGAETPYWGFSSSPLVSDGLVIVAAAGQLAAYDRATGAPRWTGPDHGDGYSSPHRLTIGGVRQIVLISSYGVSSLAPADGAVLWEHAWGGFASLQPAAIGDGELLISTGSGMGGLGIRRLAVTVAGGSAEQGSGLPSRAGQDLTGKPAAEDDDRQDPRSAQPEGQWSADTRAAWSIEELWTSTGLKPYFNDFVVHEGHAYGFDGRILSCIDLAGGERKWKGGRYGNGQLILIADQDVLLVLSDEGELALVRAAPTEFQELARFPAIEGKTWNHPALAGDILLVRNDQEMAAFRLTLPGK